MPNLNIDQMTDVLTKALTQAQLITVGDFGKVRFLALAVMDAQADPPLSSVEQLRKAKFGRI
jgi:hypothetical protein